MMTKQQMELRFPKLSMGMAVYTGDGEKLGSVVALDDESFTVEKGIFFPKDFTARYSDIIDVDSTEERIVLNRKMSELDSWRDANYHGWGIFEGLNLGGTAVPGTVVQDREDLDTSSFENEKEIRVPVAKEELDVQKTQRQAGEVRVHKVVHTEMQHVTVPVRHEEVKIERMAAADGASPSEKSDSELFRDETIRIPVMGEEVEIHKRPVIQEEIRIRKTQHTDDKTYADSVRREDVEVDEEGDTTGRTMR